MARRSPQSAAKRKREADKRAKRQEKLERRARRAAERVRARDATGSRDSEGNTMTAPIEYNGHVIEPMTQLNEEPRGWTLEVRIRPVDGDARARRCRAPNLYASEDVAVERCLEFGRQIVDGKLKPRVRPAT